MKIHRVSYYIDHDGLTYEWAPTKAAAKAIENGLFTREDVGEVEIELVEIPTDKAGLIEWLNQNLTRDNG